MLLPGTTLQVEDLSWENVQNAFSHIFSTGGLMLSQVAAIGGMELHSVQNWVKRGFCSPPVGKKYNVGQFCRLVTVNMLKDCLTIPEIIALISHINGRLDDEGDDVISDDRLYFVFVEMLRRTEGSTGRYDSEIEGVLSACGVAVDSHDRVAAGLKIMLCAYRSSHYKKSALELLGNLQGAF